MLKNTMTNVLAKNRNVYLDYIKGIATFLVLFNHTYAFSMYQQASTIPFKVLSLLLVTITALNWPLFFMISGALLLGKKESLKDVISKRILRIGGVLLTYQLIIMFIAYLNKGTHYSLWDILYGICTNSFHGAYQSTWYLYAYLGFLLMVPLLRHIAEHINKLQFIYLIVVILLYHAVLPLCQALLNWYFNLSFQISSDFRIPLLVGRESMYALVGYCVINKSSEAFWIKNKNKCILSAIFMLAISVTMEYLAVYYFNQSTYPYSAMFISCLAAIFIMYVKHSSLWKSGNSQFTKVIQLIGERSLGIYLSAPIMQSIFYSKYHNVLSPYIPVFLSSVFWCILTVALCLPFILLLRKIPVIRKVL